VSLIKGQLCISRPRGGGEEYISIEFTDADARVRFATFKIGLEDFSRALTGLGYVPGEIELRGLEYVGMKSENKSEIVLGNPFVDEKALQKKVAELEIDGWKARAGDLENHHNYTKDGVRVVFFRHVKK
jgi:hypothetical protein